MPGQGGLSCYVDLAAISSGRHVVIGLADGGGCAGGRGIRNVGRGCVTEIERPVCCSRASGRSCKGGCCRVVVPAPQTENLTVSGIADCKAAHLARSAGDVR